VKQCAVLMKGDSNTIEAVLGLIAMNHYGLEIILCNISRSCSSNASEDESKNA
jgi:hypothetical protein